MAFHFLASALEKSEMTQIINNDLDVAAFKVVFLKIFSQKFHYSGFGFVQNQNKVENKLERYVCAEH